MALVGQHRHRRHGPAARAKIRWQLGFSAGYGLISATSHSRPRRRGDPRRRHAYAGHGRDADRPRSRSHHGGSQAEVAFMVSAWAAPTRWITVRPVAWTLRRVSLRLPSPQADVDHQGRRLVADHLEEAERGQVAGALGGQGRDPGNRSRGDGGSQPAIGLGGSDGGEVSCMAVSRKSTEGTPIMPQPRSSRDRLRRSPAPPGAAAGLAYPHPGALP